MGAKTTASPNGRTRLSASEWQARVKRFEASGRSGAAFCRAEGISRSTFDLWRRKLKAARPAAKKGPQEFVEIRPLVERLGGWAVEIELPDGTLARMRG
jgi:putative transposase